MPPRKKNNPRKKKLRDKKNIEIEEEAEKIINPASGSKVRKKKLRDKKNIEIEEEAEKIINPASGSKVIFAVDFSLPDKEFFRMEVQNNKMKRHFEKIKNETEKQLANETEKDMKVNSKRPLKSGGSKGSGKGNTSTGNKKIEAACECIVEISQHEILLEQLAEKRDLKAYAIQKDTFRREKIPPKSYWENYGLNKNTKKSPKYKVSSVKKESKKKTKKKKKVSK